MPEIIRGNAIVADRWQVWRPESPEAALPAGPVLVPLGHWLSNADALLARGDAGVWLPGHEDPVVLAAWVQAIPVIAIEFPKFTDGRGYSAAHLLRARLGFRGELRAIGDVLPDQLFYMYRVGFDAFAVRADKDIAQALRTLAPFTQAYQGTWREPLPAFRRAPRAEAVGEGSL